MMRRILAAAAIACATNLLCPPPTTCQELEIDWVPGPASGVLGDEIAEIDVAEGYIFAGPEDSVELMEYMGNPPSRAEAGFIAPATEEQSWFIVFEYHPIGYIPDDEKDNLDPDAILENVRQGTEQANRIREEQGHAKIHVSGWYEKPHYDETTHNLVWALLAEDDYGNQVMNYNTRLLGRHGYMSAVLVAGPDEFAAYRDQVEGIISTFRYREGKDYLSFVQGDKVAKYGLTALVAGGVGAAAAKTGLLKILAKGGKAIFIAVAAAVAGFFKWVKGMGQRKRAVEQG